MNFGISEELIKKACELSMKAHECCDESNQYIYKECQWSLPAAALFSFAGVWSVRDWFDESSCYGETDIDLDLFPSLKSIGNQEPALVNQAFLCRFRAILENSSLSVEVDETIREGKQVVFAGHSSGGPMAIFATLWFLEKYTNTECSAAPRCVTFGCPLVGNHIFPHAINRENWSQYFIHFVTKYDIVPRIMFAPCNAFEGGLQQVLDFSNPRSIFYKHTSLITSREASSFVENVLTNLSSVASNVACNLMGCTNLLVQNFSSFVDLSPYRPFGTFIFCTRNRKMVVVRNSNAVLQFLSHSSQLQSRDEGTNFAGQILEESLLYNDILQHSAETDRVITYLDSLSAEALKTGGRALDDLGFSLRAKLCLLAAEDYEQQKLRREEKIDKESIKEKHNWLQEYRKDCELRKGGYYFATKTKADEQDLIAGVVGLQLGAMWDEIVEMIKMYQLPDEFEAKKEWIELGAKDRQLVEPIAIAAYYVRGLNDNTGPFMLNGRSSVFKLTQRWSDHRKKLPIESITESCFWAEVEELMLLCKKSSYEDLKERILRLENQILHWNEAKVLQEDVFWEKSILRQWWNLENTSRPT
ncbi:hypothetical protein DCAR_0415222 [Daucus carota subsp. sativus]|uniref:Uncharacterized protein n=1 Tax=Daucus carota subsp. sativus TaxID=79200 RepID=A0A165A8W1_DAUCS|nr:PREDICTED: protein EDS1B-like [Daucus carota subsp. sativus]WOG95893.1 hypothetical protein DCAR_0415222 [Daucus carota subsp. sativus]